MLKLNIYVEGQDDALFFEQVVIPLLDRSSVSAEVSEYRQRPKQALRKELRILAKTGARRIVVSDLDSSPCFTKRKEKLKREVGKLADDEFLVVERCIEGWYLAGLTKKRCGELKIRPPQKLDTVSKEVFNNLIPAKFSSRRDFLQEILRDYSVTSAKRRSPSFAYAIQKHFS